METKVFKGTSQSDLMNQIVTWAAKVNMMRIVSIHFDVEFLGGGDIQEIANVKLERDQ